MRYLNNEAMACRAAIKESLRIMCSFVPAKSLFLHCDHCGVLSAPVAAFAIRNDFYETLFRLLLLADSTSQWD